jgi:ribosome-binding protein aMBF1 (putative translation factor)
MLMTHTTNSISSDAASSLPRLSCISRAPQGYVFSKGQTFIAKGLGAVRSLCLLAKRAGSSSSTATGRASGCGRRREDEESEPVGRRSLPSPSQCRAARALVGWSQDDLAAASLVAKATIANFDLGKSAPYKRTLGDLRVALEAAGVGFTDGDQPGVRLKEGAGVTKYRYQARRASRERVG